MLYKSEYILRGALYGELIGQYWPAPRDYTKRNRYKQQQLVLRQQWVRQVSGLRNSSIGHCITSIKCRSAPVKSNTSTRINVANRFSTRNRCH